MFLKVGLATATGITGNNRNAVRKFPAAVSSIETRKHVIRGEGNTANGRPHHRQPWFRCNPNFQRKGTISIRSARFNFRNAWAYSWKHKDGVSLSVSQSVGGRRKVAATAPANRPGFPTFIEHPIAVPQTIFLSPSSHPPWICLFFIAALRAHAMSRKSTRQTKFIIESPIPLWSRSHLSSLKLLRLISIKYSRLHFIDHVACLSLANFRFHIVKDSHDWSSFGARRTIH